MNPDELRWLTLIGGPGLLDQLPGRAVLLPGESAVTIDALVDLATGEPVEGVRRVPVGAVYARLEALEPYLRRRSAPLYSGQAGLSGRGTILGSDAGPDETIGATGEGTGQADVP